MKHIKQKRFHVFVTIDQSSPTAYLCLAKSFSSHPGGNKVDGLPPASSLSLSPKRNVGATENGPNDGWRKLVLFSEVKST